MATRAFCLLLGGVLPFVIQSPLYASIEISPALLVSNYWTDNVSLTADDQRQAETIIEIKPELSLSVDSRRHQATLYSSYQYLTYRRTNETREFQEYNAASSSVLATDLLFIDLAASKFQSAVSEQSAVAVNNLSLISNRTDVSSYNINPYLSKQWNVRWRSQVDYVYDDIRYETGQFNNSQTQQFSGLVGYGQSDDKLQADLSYTGQKTDYDLSPSTSRFDEIRFDTRYQMNLTWTLLFNIGYEDNKYASANAGVTKGRFGEVGVEIKPTRKILFTGVVGDRYYGSSALLRLQYSYNEQSGLEAGFRKELTLIAAGALQNGIQTGDDNQFDILSNVFLSTETYEVRSSDVRLYSQWARSRGELAAYREQRTYQLSLSQEMIDYVEATLAWFITPRSTLGLDLSVRDRKIDNQAGSDRLQNILVRLETTPTKNSSVGGELGVTSRGGGAFQSYSQQQFRLFAQINF